MQLNVSNKCKNYLLVLVAIILSNESLSKPKTYVSVIDITSAPLGFLSLNKNKNLLIMLTHQSNLHPVIAWFL